MGANQSRPRPRPPHSHYPPPNIYPQVKLSATSISTILFENVSIYILLHLAALLPRRSLALEADNALLVISHEADICRALSTMARTLNK